MVSREHLKAQLVRHEGYRSHPYRCTAGKLTIGVGRNLDDRGLSPEEIEYLLENDIREAEGYAKAYPWYETLDPVRQNVVVNLCFNLGPTRFGKFKQLHAALAVGDWARAKASLENSLWHKQVGRRAPELELQLLSGVLA